MLDIASLYVRRLRIFDELRQTFFVQPPYSSFVYPFQFVRAQNEYEQTHICNRTAINEKTLAIIWCSIRFIIYDWRILFIPLSFSNHWFCILVGGSIFICIRRDCREYFLFIALHMFMRAWMEWMKPNANSNGLLFKKAYSAIKRSNMDWASCDCWKCKWYSQLCPWKVSRTLFFRFHPLYFFCGCFYLWFHCPFRDIFFFWKISFDHSKLWPRSWNVWEYSIWSHWISDMI